MAHWPIVWLDVPKDLWSQLAALHERALRRWPLTQLLEHWSRAEDAELQLLLEWHDWPWWPDEEYPHELRELSERLPERHALDAEWLQPELHLEREVRQLVLQLHLERVWSLLPDRPEKQPHLRLTA